MAGNNDRVFGFNPTYRNEEGPENLHSFDWIGPPQVPPGRPTAFLNRAVAVPPEVDPALDHQGHIVPQNVLNMVLDPLMQQMAAQVNDLAGVEAFIQANQQQYPWLPLVLAYGQATGVPMFDFEEDDPEDRVGGFFSIVTWNPINITRAPSDDRRGGQPGNHIDRQVVDYIAAHPDQQPNAAWLERVEQLLEAINRYINVCSQSLAGQQQVGTGYYSFPWAQHQDALIPDPD